MNMNNLFENIMAQIKADQVSAVEEMPKVHRQTKILNTLVMVIQIITVTLAIYCFIQAFGQEEVIPHVICLMQISSICLMDKYLISPSLGLLTKYLEASYMMKKQEVQAFKLKLGEQN